MWACACVVFCSVLTFVQVCAVNANDLTNYKLSATLEPTFTMHMDVDDSMTHVTMERNRNTIEMVLFKIKFKFAVAIEQHCKLEFRAK